MNFSLHLPYDYERVRCLSENDISFVTEFGYRKLNRKASFEYES